MKSLHPLSNHISRLPAKTVKAFAHGLSFDLARFGERNIAAVPSKGFIADPATLTTSGRNPNDRFSSTMNNFKRPFGLKIQNVPIWNQYGMKWIYNFNHIISKDHFGPNPQDVSDASKNDADNQLNVNLQRTSVNEVAVYSKKRDQSEGHPSPNKIASGLKSFFHEPIITGATK